MVTRASVSLLVQLLLSAPPVTFSSVPAQPDLTVPTERKMSVGLATTAHKALHQRFLALLVNTAIQIIFQIQSHYLTARKAISAREEPLVREDRQTLTQLRKGAALATSAQQAHDMKSLAQSELTAQLLMLLALQLAFSVLLAMTLLKCAKTEECRHQTKGRTHARLATTAPTVQMPPHVPLDPSARLESQSTLHVLKALTSLTRLKRTVLTALKDTSATCHLTLSLDQTTPRPVHLATSATDKPSN